MGSFFKCVEALWKDKKTGAALEPSLPTIDTDKETISPLSEEDERSDDEDIKVVEKKLFVTPSKAKCPQPWYTPSSKEKRDDINANQVKRQRRERAKVVRQVTSRGSPRKTPEKSTPKITRASRLTGAQLCPETESAVDGGSSHRGSVTRKTSDERMTSDIMNQTETPRRHLTRKRNRSGRENGGNLSHQTTGEEDLCNGSVASTSTSCEPYRLQRISVEYIQQDREEPQADVLFQADDPQTGQPEDVPAIRETCDPLLSFPDLIGVNINNSACDEVRGKKRKNKKKMEKGDCGGMEEGMELPSSQEGPEGRDAGTCVSVEISELSDKKKNRKDSSSRDIKILRPEERSVEEDGITERDNSQLKEKKKKSKKNKSAVDVTMRDGLEEGTSESLYSEQVDESHSQASAQVSEIVSCDEIAAASQRQEDEDGNLEPNVRAEEGSVLSEGCKANDGRERRKKKGKRVSENDEVLELSSNAAARPSNEDAEIQKKKKKRKKERYVIVEEQEEEVALDLNLDPPLQLTGQLERSDGSTPTLRPGLGPCLESTDVSQGTSDSTDAKNSQHSSGRSALQLEDVTKPRKKFKKKQRSSSNDETEAGQEEENVDITSSNDAETLTDSTVLSAKKKKKKEKRDEGADIWNTPEETQMNPKVKKADKSQRTGERSADQDAELGTKKKKKKMTEMSARDISVGAVAQSDDSVSVRQKKKKGAASFLVDDTVEKDAKTHRETSAPSQSVASFDGSRQKRKEKLGVSACDFETEPVENVGSNDMIRKRKRKKKTSTSQDSVVKDHEEDFEEPNDKCQSSGPQITVTWVEGKKKHKKNDRELETPMVRRDSAADLGRSLSDETVVLEKKKKKKKCKDPHSTIQESAPAPVEDVESARSVSPKKKSRQSSSPSAEISHDSSISEKVFKKTLVKNVTNMCEAEHAEFSSKNPVLNAMKKKKEKKKKCGDDDLSEGTLLSESVEVEPHIRKKKKKKKEKERNKMSAATKVMSSGPMLSESSSPPRFEMLSSSDHMEEKKPIQGKRRLHYPDQDFLTTD
ncbi:enolase-phosphatase E1-like [Centroberyx affinis]|uniref:enolase-phosphatase E1-like n=1 Tax=Centroberyx affinis TaxID=166261 RepID=UPI003A5C687E